MTSIELRFAVTSWLPVVDVFSCKLTLSPGKYAYQLVVDDKWMLDPMNPDKVDNNMGGINSLVSIGNVSAAELPKLHTNWANGNLIRIETFNNPEQFFVLWDNFNLSLLLVRYTVLVCSRTSINDVMQIWKLPLSH